MSESFAARASFGPLKAKGAERVPDAEPYGRPPGGIETSISACRIFANALSPRPHHLLDRDRDRNGWLDLHYRLGCPSTRETAVLPNLDIRQIERPLLSRGRLGVHENVLRKWVKESVPALCRPLVPAR
jgi:hypothetical protein